MLKYCGKGEFLLLSKIFCNVMLDFYVKTRIRFSLREKRLFEITEVEVTRVDCTYIFVNIRTEVKARAGKANIISWFNFIKDCLPYLFVSFRNKYFNKISLGNMLYVKNKLYRF